MSDVAMEPITTPIKCAMTPPGSKSLTNRALVLAALSDGISTISNLLFADDTLVMLEGLGRLGFHIEIHHDERWASVHGRAGQIPKSGVDLFCGNSGTTMRFLTAMCALGHGRFVLDGIARMRERPMGQLWDLLRNLGVRIEALQKPNYPPLAVLASGMAGGIARFGAAQSSQFLSAVLQVCPYAKHECQIDLEPRQTSWPYVAMTMQLMDHFGLTPELLRDPNGEPNRIVIPRGAYKATDYQVEPDASNASYFLATAAIHAGSKVTIEGLGKRSLQGDVGLADLLHQMGAGLLFGKDFITVMGTGTLNGIEADMSSMPDMAQTIGVVALFARGETVLTGLHTLRLKETDRITALATELRKFGAEVEIEEDDLIITPPSELKAASVDTYDDHRMAMSFAVAGTKIPGVVIKDAQCVNKTYPGFFEDLKKLGA